MKMWCVEVIMSDEVIYINVFIQRIRSIENIIILIKTKTGRKKVKTIWSTGGK